MHLGHLPPHGTHQKLKKRFLIFFGDRMKLNEDLKTTRVILCNKFILADVNVLISNPSVRGILREWQLFTGCPRISL
jgi:hypothetical protein